MSSKDFKTVTGKIPLKRENSNQTAAFSLVQAPLSALENRLQFLHPTEITISKNHRFDARKKTYLLGRFASRAALSLLMPTEKLSSVSIGSGVFTFPIIEGASGGLAVSITHCEDIGMAVVHPQGHPLAIDLEKVDPKQVEVVEPYFTTKEQNLILQTGLSKEVGYLLAWTIKESLSKVLRTGLTLDLKLLELQSIHRKGNHYESLFTNFGQYKTISYQIGTYVCSLVLPKFTTLELEEFEAGIKELGEII